MTKGKKSTKKNRTSKKWCSKCGFHIRGDDHEKGLHHLVAGVGVRNEKTGIGIPGRTGERTKKRR